VSEISEIKKYRDALEKIAYHGQHSGVIPCPQDHSFYIEPMQKIARNALAGLALSKTPNSVALHEDKELKESCPICESPERERPYFLLNSSNLPFGIMNTENSHACTDSWHSELVERASPMPKK
jgi:hypothetical protein